VAAKTDWAPSLTLVANHGRSTSSNDVNPTEEASNKATEPMEPAINPLLLGPSRTSDAGMKQKTVAVPGEPHL